jgi:Uma2 family endonuclease
MATTKRWTRADLERFPIDGIRYEVLNGKLFVTPLPSIPHQVVAMRLAVQIAAYCDRHQLGFATAPGAVPKGESELQPDISVIFGHGMWDTEDWARLPKPALVVEVLSPSTQHRDRGVKREAYLRWGIPEYWIVDTEKRDVTVVRLGREDERVVDTLRWQPRADLPALQFSLAGLFR